MTFDTIKNNEKKFIMPTYSRFDTALVSGKGATAMDCGGKEYIDFTAGIGVNSLGYCDSKWAQAVAMQAKTLQHTSNLYYSPLQAELASKLCGLSGMSKVFFGNSGAEANECAIKLARKYGTENFGDGHTEIITLKNSFHGRTVTTLAATGQNEFHEYFTPLTGGFKYASPNMESIKKNAGENTCAVMVELIQGEGGVIPLGKEFVKELRGFCTKNKLLLIVDEVQTGVGRTGAFYCYQNYGITPDIVTSAKGLGGGLPIGACLCCGALGDVMGKGSHGSTFGGNPVVCAGALEVLKRVGSKPFLDSVNEKGAYMSEKLQGMAGIAFVRGMGLMLGAKPASGSPAQIAAKCAANGLLVLTAKDVLRFLPPLVITKDEIDRGLQILKQTLSSI